MSQLEFNSRMIKEPLGLIRIVQLVNIYETAVNFTKIIIKIKL
jgi:hypothetical protein